jgi:hypothetical protein
VTVGGLAPGRYQVEQWDTYTGRVVGITNRASAAGAVLIYTPERLASDLAYKVRAVR